MFVQIVVQCDGVETQMKMALIAMLCRMSRCVWAHHQETRWQRGETVRFCCRWRVCE